MASVSLCPRFAALSACSARESSSGELFFRGPPCTSLAVPASSGRGIGRASMGAERRPPASNRGKWKKSDPTKPAPTTTKPALTKPAPTATKPAPTATKPAPTATKPAPPPLIEKQPEPDNSEPPKWEEFSAAVSGEWDGYSAEFNMFAEPLELPSEVIPDAFREWGQQVHDWQTQCPTQAHPEHGHLWYKVMKLLPTVGCEADAATVHSVEVCDVTQSASALAYHKSGSYTAVWRGKRVENESKSTGPGKEVSREGDEIEVEQCLVHEKMRIRVFQRLDRRRKVLVFREAWEGPFRNGESLGGCAAVTQAFAKTAPFEAKSLVGKWNSDLHTLRAPHSQQEGYRSSELVHTGNEVVEKTFSSTFLYLGLPKDTWTLLLKADSGETTIETGWLAQPDLAIVTTCEIGSSGDLKEATLRIEKQITNQVAPVNWSPEELEELLTE